MPTLADQRCLNHETREAVCRCPGCGRFFCRECVVVFESRLLCASCLAAESASERPQLPQQGAAKRALALALIALLVAWLFFYTAGWAVLQFREHTAVAVLAASTPGPKS
jgi:hypothetical protein